MVVRILGKDDSNRSARWKSNLTRSGRIGVRVIRNGGILMPSIAAQATNFPFLGDSRARGRESKNDRESNQAHSPLLFGVTQEYTLSTPNIMAVHPCALLDAIPRRVIFFIPTSEPNSDSQMPSLERWRKEHS